MPEPKLDTLLARLVEGTITDAEFQALEQLLDNNAEAQRRYLHYLDLHADLQAVDHKSADDSRRPRWAAVLIAAAALFVVGLFLYARSAPKPVIRVVDSDGPVHWSADAMSEVPITAGAELAGGTLETPSADSWVKFSFSDQTSVTMAGQSMLTVAIVDGQKILRLEKGNLSVEASKQPSDRPLQLSTPSAEIEVLGTQFNVRAGAHASRIVVNEGRVRVTRLADGRVEEVDADEVLVARVEKTAEFAAKPRRPYAESWQSRLPLGVLQGQWEPGQVRAMPHIWKGEPDAPRSPILLYTVVLDPSPGRQPPFRITAGSKLQIRGRMDPKHKLHMGFATSRPHGGLSGKYFLHKGVAIEADEAGEFTLDVDMEMFVPKKGRFPASPIGQEVVYLWMQTVEVDAGLVIQSVRWGK